MSSRENRQFHIRIMLGIALACAIVLIFLPAIPQPPEFHKFADMRKFLGIPNFFDVISNILFMAACLYGLKLLFDPRDGVERAKFEFGSEVIAYAVFFIAAGLTCVGSIWYHLWPSNFTLVWDRLPMTLLFSSFLVIVISERLHRKGGLILLAPLIAIGIFSIWQWYQSELAGHGDLRLYLAVQFMPFLLVLYMLFFLPSRYSRSSRFGWILLIYALAKAAELFDHQVFDLTQQWVSGHTIKHILAALAVFALAEMLRCRIPINRLNITKRDLDDF